MPRLQAIPYCGVHPGSPWTRSSLREIQPHAVFERPTRASAADHGVRPTKIRRGRREIPFGQFSEGRSA